MADETQATAEGTATEETQEQTSETEVNGSEAEQTTTEESGKGKGDPWVAMHQERLARQELEKKLSDPQFVYQQAKKLGLTEDASEGIENTPTPAPAASTSFEQYRYFREIEKAQEKYPQLSADVEDQVAVTALMNTLGLSPLQAAERYYKKVSKAQETAAAKAEEQKAATESTKTQASSVQSSSTTSSDMAEYEDLVRRSRDYRNPKDAEKAQLELILWKNKHRT
jgi:hypothetical protein